MQPPRGWGMRVSQRISSGAFGPNWGSTCGNLEPLKLALYRLKVADLRKAYPKIDWSDVKAVAELTAEFAAGCQKSGPVDAVMPDGAKRRPGRQVVTAR